MRPRVFFAFCALATLACAQAASAPESRPVGARNDARLVVLIVVDQLSPEVLKGAWPHLGEDGFRRLAREGVAFGAGAYDYACSETGPGHATLGTGTSPSVHGIVGNAWMDPATGNLVGCVDDVRAPLIPAGERGASAHRLLAPTLGDAMKAACGPKARVVGVSIKDRSAILPVGAAADRAVWFDRKAGRFVTSLAFARDGREPPWIGRLNARFPITRYEEFLWPKDRDESAYADLGADDEPFEHTLDGSRAFPHRISASKAPSHAWFVEEVCASPAGLELVSGAATLLLEDAELGRDDVPDFLSISFSSNDLVGHLFGPESHEVRDMTIRTDRVVAAILKRLDEAAGLGRYDVALSADHGIGPIPEALARRGVEAGRINVDKIKLAVEAAFRERFGAAPEKQHWVTRVVDTDVLLNRKLLAERHVALRDAQDHAAKAAAAVPNVAEAIPLHAVFDGSLAPGPIHDAMRRAQMESRSADVYVLPKPRFLLTTAAATHGTPYDYDCRVPLFFFGPGFKRGAKSDHAVAPGSIVPTLARALGIAPPSGATYPVLDEALAK